jgi:hypothetical protein
MKKINKKIFSIKYLYILIFLLILGSLLVFSVDSFLNALLIFVGFSIIFIYLISKKNKDYFDPIFLFSIFYVFVFLAAFLMNVRGIDNNLFIYSTYFYNDLNYIYTLSILVCVISYISVVAGYEIFASKSIPSKPKSINLLRCNTFFIFSLFYCLIGIANFIYNIFQYSGGDIIAYYKNISLRNEQFSQQGTTVGYIFLYAGSYMMFIRSLQESKNTIFSIITVIVSLFIFFSNGRIINSILFLLSFLMIYYYNRGGVNLNRYYFVIGVSMPLIGILFYALRFASSLSFNDMYEFTSGGFFNFLQNFFSFDLLAYFIVDKGNIPNFAVLMKVIDSWEKELGIMFGLTLSFPLYSIISVDFFNLIQMPAVITTEKWYSHIPGGNIPVTGMGEMIINFSIVGFPIGMFLFGVMGAFFRNMFIKYRSNIFLIFYSKFCFFFMIYPKGEFNNFNLFWMSVPSIIFIFTLFIIQLRFYPLNKN